jgi:hypothetical protein
MRTLDCLDPIMILMCCNVFYDLANGKAPPVEFNVNHNIYNIGYCLANWIYPDWHYQKTIIGCTLSEAVHLEPLPNHILIMVRNLNRC